MSMRALNLFLAGWLVIVLAGCVGYHLGPVNNAVAGGRSIEVLPFNNQTLQPRLGDALTQSLRKHLQADGTFHLDTHGDADLVVSGVIRGYSREAVGFLDTDATVPEDYRVEVVAHITVRDSVSGKLVLDKDVKGHTLVNIGADLASAERQALPLLADDLAQSVTELLTEGAW